MSDDGARTWFEAFGSDKNRVDGFVLREAAAISKIFTPFRSYDPLAYRRWSEALGDEKRVLSAQSTWEGDIMQLTAAQMGQRPGQPMGTVDAATIEAVLATMVEAGLSEQDAGFALWEGYADSPPIPDTVAAEGAGAFFVPQGGVRTLAGPITELRNFADQEGRHFPIAVWTEDLSFALAQPIYHDALYVSASTEVDALLRRRGDLDLCRIDRGLPLGHN